MATGGSQENAEPHICAICWGTFHDPKFLPCYHTFCAPCIQSLADYHPWGSFLCPSCRHRFTLPSGGVASLQTNFYIQPHTAQPPSGSSVMCAKHPDEKLKFYCETCNAAICRDCKLTKHEGHPTVDLPSAAVTDKRKELLADKSRVQVAMCVVSEQVMSLNEERELQAQKRATVEKNIRDRHATVVAIADRQRDEALHSLQAVGTDLDRDIARALEQPTEELAQLSDLLQRVNDTVASGRVNDVIAVTTETRSGCGSLPKVQALMSREKRTLQRPVLHFDIGTDAITQAIRGYMGRVGTMQMEERKPEVKVTERFWCGQDPDMEIFSLCHASGNPPEVIVSYEQCGMKKDAPVKSFSETGYERVQPAVDNQRGKCSFKCSVVAGCLFYTVQDDEFGTMNKSPTATNFLLYNKLTGQADIRKWTIPESRFSDIKTKFTIQVGAHRAFDVDKSERYFAVVEEGRESTARRCVRLYRESMAQAIGSYSPPTADYQPSDVCFYTLGGKEVLLITDEINDNIHVVTLEGDALCFQRYLCGSSPSLIQPMAMSVDMQGHLWVGCRGGAVLTIEQVD